MRELSGKKRMELVSGLEPDPVYHAAKKAMILLNRRPVAGMCDLERFRRGKITPEKIRKFRKVLYIRKGYYDYEYFNICFLNNVLVLCLKALCEGYLPRVEILNSKGENIWEMFFRQPFDDIPEEGKKKADFDEKVLEVFPAWKDVFPGSENFESYSLLYNRIPKLAESAEEYIRREKESLLTGKKVLGVLCRGTDYTRTRPKGHPIQPEPADILAKAKEVYTAGKYDAVYLATEDSGYDRLFREAFGEKLLVNRRNYYDRAFEQEKLTLIKDVHFDREDDEYLKGLEYISSLMILSDCDGLVAGNCGGTQAAAYWNGGKYVDAYIFDLGLYE